jgi:hypothetical protein
MARPDIDVIAAVAADCANSRFPTIRDLAENMNALLTYIGELEGERDALADKVAGRDEQIERQRLLIAKVDEYADRIWRSANSAYRKAGRELLEMIAIAQEAGKEK